MHRIGDDNNAKSLEQRLQPLFINRTGNPPALRIGIKASSPLMQRRPVVIVQIETDGNQLQPAGRAMIRQRVLKLVKQGAQAEAHSLATGDRKSTRLNSSHVAISYAVFCLKKKK